MKQILLIFIFITLVKADIDFSNYLDSDEIPLKVINVSSDEVLNLRLEPFYSSKIIYYIPHDAKNIITYDRDILSKMAKNGWVEIKVWFEDGFYLGWVRGKYLQVQRENRAISNRNLVIIYPKFLTAELTKDNFIHIYLDDMQECGDKNSINIKLRVYYSLPDVFSDNDFNVTYGDVARYGWFKKSNSFADKINLYGLSGYMSRRYSSNGCIITDYFFKVDGKVLFIESLSKDKEVSKNKSEILKAIIKNLKVL
jgi:hypothetical protein